MIMHSRICQETAAPWFISCTLGDGNEYTQPTTVAGLSDQACQLAKAKVAHELGPRTTGFR